jgi:hypothetical protein
MPFQHDVDPASATITIRVDGSADTNGAMVLARQLITNCAIDESYSLIIVVGELTTQATPEELRALAEILKLVGRKIKGRKAIVAAQVGRLTIARLLALAASTHDDVEAFTSESAARAWLAAGNTRSSSSGRGKTHRP